MNRHPVDRMADIKAQLEMLEVEFTELREKLLAGEVEPIGTEWKATIARKNRRIVRIADAERVLPQSLFEAIVRLDQHAAVTLRRIDYRPKKPHRYRPRSRKRKASR